MLKEERMPFDPVVGDLYATGVDAVRGATAGFGDDDWARPACGIWTGTDLAGHLVTVIGWYRRWLDRAEAGDATPEFPPTDLDARAAADLAALPPGTGPERVAAFADAAHTYATRLADVWDVPYGYPRGTVTAGLHAAVASWEWHVHAWDLVTAAGGRYRPDEPDLLYARGLECLRAATGADLAAEPGDPWAALLRRTGRAG